jgi:hypothetical protein
LPRTLVGPSPPHPESHEQHRRSLLIGGSHEPRYTPRARHSIHLQFGHRCACGRAGTAFRQSAAAVHRANQGATRQHAPKLAQPRIHFNGKKSLYQVPQATNPYGTTPANNPSAGFSAGRASPAAVSYASTAQYRSICRIGDSEEGAGGTCRYQTTVSKSRGDKCQCRGQSGTIQ